jgi:hypothetical protein
VRDILDYDVPVVVMVDYTFDDAVEAFIRINTQGVKLKREDIESARVAAEHSGFIADEVHPFLSSIRQQGFTRLNVMHLFRACAFVAHPDGRNRTPLNELGRREVLEAWGRTKRATEQAIDVIRGELGLVNMEVLWSGALLVPVIAICAVSRPAERDSKALAGWVALAALLHRYSRSTETLLDQDLRACRGKDPVGGLLANLREIRANLRAVPEDFGGSLNDRSGLLAAYVACKHRGILDLLTGGMVLLQGRVDRHHILPRGQFPERERTTADHIANIAFIADDVNRSINVSGPEVYLKRIAIPILESQCIPTDPDLWSIENATTFWKRRRELLAEAFNGFLDAAFPNRRLQ